MKRLILLCLILSIVVGTVQGATYLQAYDSNNILRMHMNQTAGSPTTFVDSAPTPNIITVHGNTVTNITSKQFGNASGFFDGSSDDLSVATSSTFDLAQANWTIMFWYQPSGINNFDTWIVRDRPGSIVSYKMDLGSSNKPRFEATDAASATIADYSATSSLTFTSGNWYQMVYERNATGIYLWQNGVTVPLTASTAIGASSLINQTTPVVIGNDSYISGRDIAGNMDELNIWKGVAIPISELYPETLEVGETIVNTSQLRPSFSVNTSSGVKPLVVSFTDTSTAVNATPYSRYWQFGDGNTSTAANPTFTYNIPGIYLANLTLTNSSAPTNTSSSQTITVMDTTGFTIHPIWMDPSFTLVRHLTDSTTGAPILDASVSDTYGGSYTTTNGTFILSYPYGTVAVTYSATGYYSKTVTYVVDADSTATVQLVPLGATPGQNVWWTPHVVQVTLFDSLTMNRLYEVNVTANYNQSSMPTEWLEQLYGIQATPAGQMVNKTLNLQGETGGDGAITFTMLGSLKYDMYLTSAAYGLSNYHVAVYPSDSMLNLYVPTGSTLPVTKNSTLLALNNTRVYYYEPDIYNVTMCVDYIDTAGLTSTVTTIWQFTNNNTVINSTTFIPGVTMNTVCNTTRNVRGASVAWWFNATRAEV